MNRIPGIIPNLRCPRCGGNIYKEYDPEPGLKESKRWEQKCLQCGRLYKEPEHLPLTKESSLRS